MVPEAYLFSAGFLLGVEHAFDPDHVVAVSVFVSERKNLLRSALIGVSWGLGHTFTLLIAGVLVLLFRLSIPDSFSFFFQLIVGFMLIFIGALALFKAFKSRFHFHRHAHDSSSHAHIHDADSHLHNGRKTFFVGMVHGLVGTAALMLLILATISSIWQGLLYIVVFGVGSILGMMFVTTLIGLPFAVTPAKFDWVGKAARVAAGLIGVVFGLFIVFKAFFAG